MSKKTFPELITAKNKEIERLTARNQLLEPVLEAAILFKDATDRVRLTAIDNAIAAVQTTEQGENDG